MRALLAKWPLASAAAGGAVWLLLFPLLALDGDTLEIIERLLLLAVLVITPLVLVLVAAPDRSGHHPWVYRAAVMLQPFAAALVVVSFFVKPGLLAGLCALSWLVFTALVALFGLVRLLPRGIVRSDEFCLDAGLLYVVVGAVWLMIFRLGLHPLGFGDTITLLTAVHFHYAGFAAPVLTGMVGRELVDSVPSRRNAYRWIAVGVIAGPPLVAAGITFSRLIEAFAVVVLASSLLGLSILTLTAVVPSVQHRSVRGLLTVSSASLIVGMVSALGYAVSWSTGLLPVDIPLMARVHGLVNGFGFVGCGLAAWLVIRPASLLAAPGVPFSRFASRGRIGPDFFQHRHAVPKVDRPPRGLVDNLAEYRRPDFDPDRVDPAIRSFYEDTADHVLLVRTDWRRGFRVGARLFKVFSAWVGQMNFPPPGREEGEDLIDSRILPIDDAVDGRQHVRAWVRTYTKTGEAIYVAAYSTHALGEQTYMNIAFPLPGGNLTSVLRIEALWAGNSASGVLLTTKRGPGHAGDEGVYFANRLLPIRLPMNETIRVWAAEMDAAPADLTEDGTQRATVVARHDVWLYGIRFLTLQYRIWAVAAGRDEKADGRRRDDD